jgi:hypothetical protein
MGGKAAVLDAYLELEAHHAYQHVLHSFPQKMPASGYAGTFVLDLAVAVTASSSGFASTWSGFGPAIDVQANVAIAVGVVVPVVSRTASFGKAPTGCSERQDASSPDMKLTR